MALHGGFCYKNKNSVPGASPDPSLQLTQSICIKPSHATLSMLPHNHLHGVCPFIGLPWWLSGKESACNAGDLGSIPGLGRFSGLGRSSGEGNGYLLHYCGLENSMDCIVHGVAKSETWLSDSQFDSAYELNKEGDNIQPWHTPFHIWNQSVVPCLTVASWPEYRFLRRQIRWSGIPISLRIFHSVMIHTVKGIGSQ